MKDKILKHYWFSKSTDEALKTCKKNSKLRTEREYVEQLILDDFERQQRGQTGPESSQVIDHLESIKALLIPILEHIFITRQLSFFTAKTIKTLPGEVEKMSENEAAKFFKTAMEEALKNLRKEVGY
jgi:hypothetical protein